MIVILSIGLLAFTRYVIKFSRSYEMSRDVSPKYETVYLGMYPEILNSSNVYLLAWLVRRVVYSVNMIFFTSHQAGQVFILITSSTVMGGLLGRFKPYYFMHN